MKYSLIKFILLVCIGFYCQSTAFAQQNEQAQQWLAEAKTKEIDQKTISEQMRFFAEKQLGIPYVAGILDEAAEERLIAQFEGSDCVIFVESTTSLVKALNAASTFENELTQIRYFDGTIDGYCSRKHYFSDWLIQNEKAGEIELLFQDEDLPEVTAPNFMSTHTSAYKPLNGNPNNIEKIKEREAYLANQMLLYIPSHQLHQFADQIHEGDILAFVTTVKGLDISHTAIARRDTKTGLTFWHASPGKGVIEEVKSLQQYLNDRKNVKGVVVARLTN